MIQILLIQQWTLRVMARSVVKESCRKHIHVLNSFHSFILCTLLYLQIDVLFQKKSSSNPRYPNHEIT